ncbi:hypothetical protein CY35_07G022600 [Sphagnum magellanicum]|uniref:Uncharacterized protein n=1 Tax=Sphagnum magellanicum TaxID=128215 RepID=A0ACB8HJG9_9BRYO|nr:hypothetical protein CY35_07G022600 [Sphagnum magellanicum]
MYPLHIKGRNLYRLRTYRQPWRNEEDRQSALVEKHGRGVAARNIRAAAKAQHSHLRSKETASQKAEHMRVTRGQVQRSFTRTPENTGLVCIQMQDTTLQKSDIVMLLRLLLHHHHHHGHRIHQSHQSQH